MSRGPGNWKRLLLDDAWAAQAMFGGLFALDMMPLALSYRAALSGNVVRYCITLIVGFILARFFAWLARNFRQHTPTGAWYIGNVLFGLCSAFAAVSLGAAGYLVYEAEKNTLPLLFIPTGLMATTWWVVGWSALRLLTL